MRGLKHTNPSQEQGTPCTSIMSQELVLKRKNYQRVRNSAKSAAEKEALPLWRVDGIMKQTNVLVNVERREPFEDNNDCEILISYYREV